MTIACSHALRRAAIVVLAASPCSVSPQQRRGPSTTGRTTQSPSMREAKKRQRIPIGVYVTSLRDFDTVGDSFGIDFWVWSVHPPGDNPLNSVEFVNAKQVETRLGRDGQAGRSRMVEGQNQGDRAPRLERQQLPLRPADPHDGPRHRRIRRAQVQRGPRRFGLRRTHSAGRVARDRLRSRAAYRRKHATNLGDPTFSGKSAQEHLFVSVALERESVVGFLKLVAGVYAAIAITLLSFLMAPDQATVFSGRMAVLVGALFATVVSLQVSNTVLGSLQGVSLVDKIHIVTLVYVFAAALMAVVSQEELRFRPQSPRETPRHDLALRVWRILRCHQPVPDRASRGFRANGRCRELLKTLRVLARRPATTAGHRGGSHEHDGSFDVQRTRLTVHHLYADMMNLYGDRGNVISIKKRCEWRGIPVEVVDVGLGEQISRRAATSFSSAAARTGSRRSSSTTCPVPRAPICGPS